MIGRKKTVAVRILAALSMMALAIGGGLLCGHIMTVLMGINA